MRLLLRVKALLLSVVAFVVAALLGMRHSRRLAREEAEHAEGERRQAETARRAFARRIAALPAVVYGGTLLPDARLTLEHVSDSTLRILGRDPAALLLPGAWQAQMEPPAAMEEGMFLAAVAREGRGTRDYRVRRADGEWIWMRDTLRVVERFPDGSAEAIGTLGDITETRAIRAKAEAGARLATLGEMATGMAHELNQPLAVLALAAENAAGALRRRGEAGIPDACRRLERIAQQAQRARDIVDHLRLFGRRDDGAVEPVALARAVEGALVLTGGALRAARIEVEIDLPADVPPVAARLVPLEQALVNLLLNARDAIAAHGRGRMVRITAAQDADGVCLTVADSGGGIPEALLERMFEPFFTTKPPGQGTGLGLSICHATMASFGGSIVAENAGKGALFTLRFRVATQQVAAAA